MNANVVQMTSKLEMLGFLKTNGTQCRFVAMVSKTPVVKIRAGNPWGASAKSKSGLFKVSRKNGLINAKYNDSVRRRIAAKLGVDMADVAYAPGDVWFKHLETVDGKALPVVVNKSKDDGKHYLQYFPLKSSNVYMDDNGNVVPDDTVKPWLYKETERPDYKPATIVVELGNLVQLKASGVIVEMPEFEEAEAALAE